MKALLFFSAILLAFAVDAKKASTAEKVLIRVRITGDIQGNYEFNGPLGTEIPATEYELDPRCKLSALFRKVHYKEKIQIEAWPMFTCTFDGQKSTYKTHRIFLDPEQKNLRVNLPVLAKQLKKIHLEFLEISLPKSK